MSFDSYYSRPGMSSYENESDEESLFDFDFELENPRTDHLELNLDEEEEEKEKECCCNIHEPTAKPINDQTFGECPICYEEINMINMTVTRCGHVMHSSCVFTALEAAPCCPMCRTQLMRDLQDDDEEDEDEDDEQDEDDDEEDEQQEQEEEDTRVSVEQLSKKLQNMGYTPADFLMMYFYGDNIKTEKKEKYNEEFLSKMDDDMYGLLNGSIPLNIRDKRTYAQVVTTNNAVVV